MYKKIIFVLFLLVSQFSFAAKIDFKMEEEATISLSINATVREKDSGRSVASLEDTSIEVKLVFDEVPLEKRLELAKKNDAESIIMLAWRYYHGISVEKNFEKSLEYCKILQKLGRHDLNSLKSTLEMQILIRDALKNGKERAVIEAQSGNAVSAYAVGALYFMGKDGFEKNNQKAKEFLSLACKSGYAKSYLIYSYVLFSLNEKVEGMRFLKKAAENKSDLEACCMLAWHRINNSSDKKEQEALFNELLELANKGNDMAMAYIGNFYSNGRFVEKNEELGLKFFKDAAMQGGDPYIMSLIDFYERHSMRDEALKFARKSYAFDCKPAIEYLCSKLISEKINKVQAEKQIELNKLKERAENGDISAMIELAKKSNRKEAMRLYKKAASANSDKDALQCIFELWLEDFDPKNDLKDFKKFYKMAIDKKVFYACFVKAKLAEKGMIKSSKKTTPIKLYEFGYENGSGECAYELFRKQIAGKTFDVKKIVEYLKFAAEKNVPKALCDYGNLLLHGGLSGVEKNEEYGISLLKRAAEAENIKALEVLSKYYLQKKNIGEAEKYLRKAALLGSVKSIKNLGILYVSQKKYKEAMRRFNNCMDLGDFSAAVDISRMYYNGWGVEASEEMALVYLFVGAKKGDVESLLQYAHLLVYSENPKIRDVEKGLKIFRFLFPIYEEKMSDISFFLVKNLTVLEKPQSEIYAIAKVAKNKGVDSEYIVSCVAHFEEKVINPENRAEFETCVKELEKEFANETKKTTFNLPIVPAIEEYFDKNTKNNAPKNSEKSN